MSDCDPPGGQEEILCPHVGRRSWLNKGYTLTQVEDPGGPFDGWSYVAGSSLHAKRAALIDPHILPGSAFYDENVRRGTDVAGYLSAVRAHEGLGNGTPGRATAR